MDVLLRVGVGLPLVGATLIFLLSKCFFLAPLRAGWLMMFANLVYELLYKRLHWRRWPSDAVGLVLLAVGWAWLAGPWAATAVCTVLGLAWAYALLVDLHWRGGEMARQDRRWAWRVPLPIPRLIVVLRGPVLRRGGVYGLGDWPEGHTENFELVILNPSLVVPQWPLEVEIAGADGAVEVRRETAETPRAPEPGECATVGFALRTPRAGPGGDVHVRVQHGDYVVTKTLRIRSVFAAGSATVTRAEIRRWKGGARAAMGWRGDQDLYDPATFQSVEGLKVALGLSRRFRLPSTLYLSGRLSLVEEEHRKFCRHFGWDRRTEGLAGFIRFLKEDVALEAEMEWPLASARPYALELGNHMYLHLHTHTAADEGNQWKLRAWIGEGRYPWQAGETDSFSEQRDNALKNAQVIQEALGFRVRSWGIPGRCFDENTARALEAAGIEVASDSDASAWRNVVGLIPPHHPAGCQHLVEITKKYPGDPDNAYKIAMLKYWAHANLRSGGTFLFMAHHHLLQYEGSSCYHLTEELFRYVLGDCEGDFYVATVTALGLYWKRVLSPRTRCVQVMADDRAVTISNTGDAPLERLPLEISLSSGGRYMTLVDVPAHQRVTVQVG
jgi:hypothetical protein